MKTKYKTVLSLLLICLLGAAGKGYGQEVKPGTVLWEFETEGGGRNPAIGRDGTIYSPIRDRLYALDPNGNIKWDYYVGKPDKGYRTVIEPSIGGDGTVYTGSRYSGIVHALDGKTGTILWEKKFEKHLGGNPFCVGNDGILYITTNGNLFALDGKTGEEKWAYSVSDDFCLVEEHACFLNGTPAIDAIGTVYVSGLTSTQGIPSSHFVFALDIKTRIKKWQFKTDKQSGGSFSILAIVGDGTVYIGNAEGLYALDSKTGISKWEFKKQYPSKPAIGSDGTIYFGADYYSNEEANFFALDGKTGVKKWEFKAFGRIVGAPVIGADGTIYFANGKINNNSVFIPAKIYALDSLTGTKKWELEAVDHESDLQTSPIIGNDKTLYFTTNGKWQKKYKTVLAIKCSSDLADTPWPTFGQNAQRTGAAPTGPINVQSHPQSTVAEKGNKALLSTYSKGEWPRTYQWQRNGVAIPGATQPSLTIENATSKDSGLYRVIITNKHGSVTSDEAELKVVSPGAPKIFADGKEVVGSVVKGDKAEITLSTSFEGGSIFYTLDGSEPSFESALYDGPFTVSKTTGIRAVAYKGDFSDLAEADPTFINIVPNYRLNVSVQGQGSVVKDPGDGPYIQDAVVKLKAVPEEGWRFSGWSGALKSSFEEGTVVMGDNKNLKAKFEKITAYTFNFPNSNGGSVEGVKKIPVERNSQSESIFYKFTRADFKLINKPDKQWFYISLTKQTPWSNNNWIHVYHNNRRWMDAGSFPSNNPKTKIYELDGGKNFSNFNFSLSIDSQYLNHAFDEIAFQVMVNNKYYFAKVSPKYKTEYLEGELINLYARPSEKWFFLNWKGDATGMNPNLTVTMDRNKTVQAIFGTDLTTTATGKGKLILDPPNGPYPYGTKVSITPVPDSGYYLGIWGLDALGMKKGPIEFEIVKGNPKISALFVPLKENRFTVTTLASDGGLVISNPNSNAYVNGQEVTLTANPDPGYSFVGWTGDIESTSNPLVTLADANKTVTAQFRRNIIAPVTLTINAENGTVTRNPADELYEKGTSVELLAQPNPGYTFTGWAGALGGTASRTTLFLDDDKSITANFKASYQLAAETRGLGSVLTTPSSTTFIDGDEVILTAIPAEGYGFVGWTGDLESTDQQTTLSMDSNKRVIAHFAQLGTLTTWTRGEGTITRSPDKESYFPGAKVTLTAKPGDGFQFVSWDGQASGTSNPTTVTMDRAMSVAANFKDIKAPAVTIASPSTQETGDETFTLSGTVTDNGKIKTLVWLWKGQEMGELELVAGKFELKDQKLSGGANTITVVATDRGGNEGKATVSPTWIADRSIRIAAAKEQQEGNRIEVPIEISSKGNVGGMGFVLNYDHSYLMDPVLTWSSAAGGSINLVNSEVAGELKGTFSLGGTSLPGGDQLIGIVSFRARSVPQNVETAIGLQEVSVSDKTGNIFDSGTDVVSGDARVLVRDITGDNNANDRLDVGDATRIQRLWVGLDRARAWDVSGNDLNGNGVLDPGDVTKVLRTVVGIDPQPKRNRVIAKMGGDDEAVETAMLLIKEKTASTVTVHVQLKDMASTIAGANFQLEYPAELLKLKDKSSHAPGEIVAGNAAAIWNVSPGQTDYTKQDGTLAMAVSSPEPWTVKDGVLAEISFDVQDGADLNNAVLALSQVEVTPDGFDNRMLTGSSFNVGSGTTDKPTEPSEVEILSITRAPFAFSFAAEEGRVYEVQSSQDLRSWGTLNSYNGNGELIRFEDFRDQVFPQIYYRIRVVE